MVLVDEKPPLTPAQAATAGDEPPPYTLPPNAAVPRVRPVNFLSSARSGDGVARGDFVVDPLLVLPPALLPPSPAGEERDNLRLETRDGAIDADVWVIPGASTAFRGVIATPVEQEKTTARLNFKSQRGPMSLRLRTEGELPTTLHVTVSSVGSPVSVFLPRTFRGMLECTGPLCLSPAIDEVTTIVDEVDETRRCWIGAFEDAGRSPDSLHLHTTYGTLSLSFIDEDVPPPAEPPVPISGTVDELAPDGETEPRSGAHEVEQDLDACPKGLVQWLARTLERRLTSENARVSIKLDDRVGQRSSVPASSHSRSLSTGASRFSGNFGRPAMGTDDVD